MSKLARHSAIYFLTRCLSAVFSLLSIVFFIRWAGQEVYGHYVLLITMILFWSTFSCGWVGQVILRYTAHAHKTADIGAYRKALLWLGLAAIVLGSLFFAMALTLYGKLATKTILVYTAIFLPVALYGMALTWLQAQLQVRSYLVCEVARAGLILGLSLALYTWHGQLRMEDLLLGYAISHMLSLLLAGWLSYRAPCHLSGQPDKSGSGTSPIALAKKYLRFGLPLGLWMGSAYLVNVSDRFFVAHFLGVASAGMYSAIYDLLVKATSILFVPLLSAVHSLYMSEDETGTSTKSSILRKALCFEFVAFPLLLCAFVAATPLLSRWMDVDSATASSIVAPLTLGAFLWHVSQLLHKPMERANATPIMLVYILIVLLLNCLGNWIFIPHFGVVAAAYTTIGSAIVYIGLVLCWQWRNGVFLD